MPSKAGSPATSAAARRQDSGREAPAFDTAAYSVGDAVGVAMAARSTDALRLSRTPENAAHGADPIGWESVSPAGMLSLQDLRRAGVSALSGLFGWGTKTNTAVRASLAGIAPILFEVVTMLTVMLNVCTARAAAAR